MKRIILLMLCLFYLLTFISCVGDTGSETSGTEIPSTSTPTDGEKEELYELKIIVPSSKIKRSDDTEVGKYIADRFGIVIEYAVYPQDAQELQMIQLASSDYGEVQRMEYERVFQEYYKSGKLMSLDPYLDKLPDFQRVFADAIPYWRMAANNDLCKWDVDVPLRADTDIECNDILVRSDILEYYGWPTPVSDDDWIAFLKQALIDFPETNGLNTLGMVVPFAESWGLSALATINYEKGDSFTELSNADGGVLFDMNKDMFVDYFEEPSVKESFQFFNRLYREGILDVESLTDDANAVDDKCINGSAISVYYMHWNSRSYNNALAEAGFENMQYVKLPNQSNTQVAEGQKRAIRVEDTRSFNAWAITDKCRYPERIIELINWMCTDEGQILRQNGIEGKHWTRNDDGKRELLPDGLRALTDPEFNESVVGINLGGYGTLAFTPRFNLLLSDGQYPNLMDHSEIYDEYALTPRQKEAYEKLGWSSSTSWWVENGFFAPTGLPGTIIIDPNSPLTDTANKMFELRLKTTANMILAETEEEFESIYLNALAEHDKLNPQAVVDEYNKVYQENKSKLN